MNYLEVCLLVACGPIIITISWQISSEICQTDSEMKYSCPVPAIVICSVCYSKLNPLGSAVPDSSAEEKYSKWLCGCYKDAQKGLLSLCSHEDHEIQVKSDSYIQWNMCHLVLYLCFLISLPCYLGYLIKSRRPVYCAWWSLLSLRDRTLPAKKTPPNASLTSCSQWVPFLFLLDLWVSDFFKKWLTGKKSD